MKSSAFRRARTTAAASAGLLAVLAAGTVVATPANADPAAAPGAPAASMLAPYYTALDLTGDKQVTTLDLQVVTDHIGATPASADWPSVSVADVDADGVITVKDLAAVSERMIYDDGPFTLIEASTLDMQAAMNAGVITSVQLTQAYLDRIASLDKVDFDGPTTTTGSSTTGNLQRPLNSIITTSTVALQAAAAADATRAADGMTSMLLGIPIALKDNYDTTDMVTTGGCACWEANQTTTDAKMVAGLRDAGAVILAKASLDEFAYGFVSEFSAFQGIDSSTTKQKSALVASPYDTTKSAGGSSGGTGASISANFAALGFGTDTGGSIRVPSSYNQLVGIRPTVGLTSRDGIIPLALTQDTGGPLARSVTDAAVALDAVVGVDANDPITSEQTGLVPDSYTSYLDPTALQGKRIGFVPSMMASSNPTDKRLWDAAKLTLEAQGATVVDLTTTAVPFPTADFNKVLNEGSGSTNEFKHDLDVYIANHLSSAVTSRSLGDIIASGNFVTSRNSTYVQRNNVTPSQYDLWANPTTGTHTTQIATGNALVTKLMTDNAIDAIVYPSGTPYGTFSTNLRLSPNTGMPAVTVPMGQASPTEANPGGGVNLEFLGKDYTEGSLIGLTYAFEQATKARTAPALYSAAG
ncbi:amidase family protein [Herbiconiux sp. 11R-BC]|uniref:amidase family protein n=1 Tax=Herbiconiux sp. 11R-BC TaxID=3111637 RepID=UPI003C077F7D